MAIEVRLVGDFSDIDRRDWTKLLEASATNTVFSTPEWLTAWWAAFERERLLILIAERDGGAALMAPLFVDAGMAFFVGSGGSDYLDLIGTPDAEVIDAVLSRAAEEIPDFAGFRFYHVPDSSPTGPMLQVAAPRLGLTCHDEGQLVAPYLDAGAHPRSLESAANKKSLRRAERFFEREGTLTVQHLRDSKEVSPHLDEFFEQHVQRWAETPYPSLFTDPAQRDFYRRVVSADPPWLRFTRIDWNAIPIAFHFGFAYRGSFMWYKPTFNVEYARRSPGEALMRQLLMEAAAEEATEFDLGLGDEAFKDRFATDVRTVRTWGLYPAQAS